MQKQQLAKSFENIGEDYDRFRPGFPDAAALEILPIKVSAVLDLGAGTGKFTALLPARADRVIAVEPSESMLEVLRAKLPDVEAIGAGAESIPLPDSSVDAVTVAQAFHWFDRDPACAEIARVLVHGGTLGLLWNHSDPDCTWDRACHRVAHPAVAEKDATTESAAEELPGFTFDHRAEIAWSERITRSEYVARWLTVSSFLVADDETRAQMVAQVEEILDADPETAGQTQFELPMLTEVFVYTAT
ncbi:class I SAM-dependent methyltransferase [Microbacterium murale]|uniref:Ubiquinone/menaquinone biosynthesis C-methylase UbiE n=1 Tax=Microbacterium murale TaxID=1081040 RepID=A0ABU0PEH1_9MICO|nr:class I SAM-dependent methyltransferase [Microbacterium murale]MDQ0645723.1 ubiquinone/menaquinone biosynthesis C-methylase UbiE [Microbacterium murale]